MPSILSLQSHVAYGHVGNSAATFPLQRMGCEVWPVQTVQFAASTRYGAPHGFIVDPDQVGDIMTGLDQLGVLAITDAVLSGYQGAPEMSARIVASARLVKQRNPDAVWCCDPVMGDVGLGFYVLPGLPELMRDTVLPHTDIVTPNHFELNFLAGRESSTLSEIVAAARTLLDRGPSTVLVTSAVASDVPADKLTMVLVDAAGAWTVTTPRLARTFDGSGDVTAAVFLKHLLSEGPVAALGRTAGIVYGVLKHTADTDAEELALIAAQEEFVHPTHAFEVERLD